MKATKKKKLPKRTKPYLAHPPVTTRYTVTLLYRNKTKLKTESTDSES